MHSAMTVRAKGNRVVDYVWAALRQVHHVVTFQKWTFRRSERSRVTAEITPPIRQRFREGGYGFVP